jgi:hypothetical protein
MAGVTIAVNYALKTLWPQDRIQNLVYQDHAFMALVPKAADFVGENMYIAARYADTQGRSAAFATAQTNTGTQKGVRFLLTRAKDYQVFALDTESILASRSDKGAILRMLNTEMSSAFNNIGKSLATALIRGRSGVIGQSASTASPMTLLNINDITNFEVGMSIVASATPTGALLSGTGVITNISRDTGVVTFTGTISSLASGSYLFAEGDAAAGSGSGNKSSGLEDWIPSTAPTATTFFGVDRSVDVTRLGGLRVDCSALNPEEALMTVLSKQAREGGRPDTFLCNHLDQRNIAISLGSKAETAYMSVGEVGFQSLKVIGPKGPVSVVGDQDEIAGVGHSLQLNTWKFHSLGEVPFILDLDGNELSRVYNADSWEGRIMYLGQLACDAPGYNARVVMPA